MAHSLWLLCLLASAVALPGEEAAFLTDEQRHELAYRRRLLPGEARPRAGRCGGKGAGAPIEGQYIVFFKTTKVNTVDEGIATVRKGLRTQAASQAATTLPFPTNVTQQQQSLALDFSVKAGLTPHWEVGGTAVRASTHLDVDSIPGGRRLQQAPPPRLLGAVLNVPSGPVGTAVVAGIKQVSTVDDVVQDVCVTTAESAKFTCLASPLLSSLIRTPVASALWDGCLRSDTYLAWWGQRCGSTFSQVQWMGVYAFSKLDGSRVAGCVKQRPASGALSADAAFWLGACGAAPAAVPTLPTRVCRDPYVASTVEPAEVQGCFEHNFTAAVQTLQILHPVAACGGGKPVQMTYRGVRCTDNSGTGTAGAAAGLAGVWWQTAEPPAGSGMDAATCSLARKPGATADEALYNMDWFGSCGVPPAKVSYIMRSECSVPPPPPPPSPSPRPSWMKSLDRVPVAAGETVPAGIRRVLGAVANASQPNAYETVKIGIPVAVALLDTGVDCSHQDINVVFNKSFVTPNSTLDTARDANACWDAYDHGTNVAGVIGAKNNGRGVIGMLPGTDIVSLKVLNSIGEGEAGDIIGAALWLLQPSLDGKTPNPGNVTNARMLSVYVINMSLGWTGTPFSALGLRACAAFKALMDLGYAVVAAAGNESSELNRSMPGACEGIVAVTAMQQGDGTIDTTQNAAEWFTNYLLTAGYTAPPTPNKVNLTVAAPGEDIYSTCDQPNNPTTFGYCALSGTSQACPHVSGMFARCFSGGKCLGLSQGPQFYATEQWQAFNLDSPSYGFAKDPIRYSSSKYFGYLTNADLW